MSFSNSTQVTFPTGSLTGSGQVLAALDHPVESSKTLLITDSTPFHPVDPSWPDQPADIGKVSTRSGRFDVSDALTIGVRDGDHELHFGDIPARRGDEGFHFLVAHQLEDTSASALEALVGSRVELEVDPVRRLELSQAHTACHLMALALNQCTNNLWKKDGPFDSLGHRDFDRAAIVESRLTPLTSEDTYRFGKSLRKRRGFDVPTFSTSVPEIEACINQALGRWLDIGASIQLVQESGDLDERRLWRCRFGDGKVATIPCGGTHVSDLSTLAKVEVSLSLTDSELRVVTRVESTSK